LDDRRLTQLLSAASAAAERLLTWTRCLASDDPSERDLEEDFLRLLGQVQRECAALRAEKGIKE
jgi:hypothetical protein